MWSDESELEVYDSRRRTFIPRSTGERVSDQCIVPTVKHGGDSLQGKVDPHPDNFAKQIIEDRRQSERNILIFNHAESPKVDRADRMSEDKEIVSTTPNVVRLWFFRQDISHPVNVTLSKSDDALKL
ncbi:hypothetical protein Trydic_g21155 [Trypoxylus dichotomus]